MLHGETIIGPSDTAAVIHVEFAFQAVNNPPPASSYLNWYGKEAEISLTGLWDGPRSTA